jgi:hypothetical protein
MSKHIHTNPFVRVLLRLERCTAHPWMHWAKSVINSSRHTAIHMYTNGYIYTHICKRVDLLTSCLDLQLRKLLHPGVESKILGQQADGESTV